jgi:hypothetical protein
VLHLSTRWDFASLRKLALKSIRPPTSHDRLMLARTYSVVEWILPALSALCSRTLPLSLDEAQQMDIEDVILVATVREEIRGGALQVDPVDISRHVEMAQANHLVSKLYSGELKSGNTRQESGSTTDPVSKSVNTSITDLLDTSRHAPAESGESQLPPTSEAPQAEKLGEGNSSEEVHSREHLTLTTEVPVAAHVASAGPTTANDLRVGGGRSESEGREGGENVTEDDWAIRTIKTKDSTNVGAPVVPYPKDEWDIPIRKNKGSTSVGPSVTPIAQDDWATTTTMKKKKKKKKK